MNENDLRNLLTQLHARLGSAQSLDAEDRRLLGHRAGRHREGARDQRCRPPPDASGLESLAVKFEADHPALAETLRRLVDALAKAGI